MRSLLASLALGGTAFAAPASAQAFDANSAAIQYADLDLANPAGMIAFEGRVRAAANQLCSDYVIDPVLRPLRTNACKSLVMQSARRQLNPVVASNGGGFPPAIS